MRKLSYIFIAASLAAAISSCTREFRPGEDPHSEPLPEFCNLSVNIDGNGFSLSAGPETKASTEEIVSSLEQNKLSSLAMFILEDYEPQYIVAYRLFLPQGYYYRNIDGTTDDQGNLLADIPANRWPDGLVQDDRTAPLLNEDGVFVENYYSVGYQGFVDMENGEVTHYYTPEEGGLDNPVSADAAKMSFHYQHPAHSELERLRPGKYRAVVIANFDQAPVSFKGHHIGWYIKELVDYFNANAYGRDDQGRLLADDGTVWDRESEKVVMTNKQFKGIPVEVYKDMLKARVYLSDMEVVYAFPESEDKISRLDTFKAKAGGQASYIRNADAVVVTTAVIPFTLQAADTELNFEAERTLSRLTFKVHNASPLELRIKDFSLSPNMAQASTFLFPGLLHLSKPHGTLPPLTMDDIYRPNWQGAPLVTSDRAIVPFDPSRMYTNAMGATEFFDALVYGSRDLSNPMSYSITVEYPDMENTLGLISMELTNMREVWMNPGAAFSNQFILQGFQNELANPRPGDPPNDDYKDRIYCLLQAPNSSIRNILKQNKETDALEMLNAPVKVNDNYSNRAFWAVKAKDGSGWCALWQFFPQNKDGSVVKIKNLGSGLWMRAPEAGTAVNDKYYTTFVPDEELASDFYVTNHYPARADGKTFAVAFDCSLIGEEEISVGLWASADECYWKPIIAGETTANLDRMHFQPLSACRIDYRERLGKKRIIKDNPIRVFEPNVGVPFFLNTIARNEHLILQLNVKYNPVTQNIEWWVNDWEQMDNDITFD